MFNAILNFLHFHVLVDFVKNKLAHITAEGLGWLAVILLHSFTIPTLLALMSGLTDRTPSIDVILLVWAGLGLLYAKAILQKDMLNIITIGGGFIVQAVLMVLIFFKQ
jgi:hypothetical protein